MSPAESGTVQTARVCKEARSESLQQCAPAVCNPAESGTVQTARVAAEALLESLQQRLTLKSVFRKQIPIFQPT